MKVKNELWHDIYYHLVEDSPADFIGWIANDSLSLRQFSAIHRFALDYECEADEPSIGGLFDLLEKNAIDYFEILEQEEIPDE